MKVRQWAWLLLAGAGVARGTLSGHPAAVPGSEGEYHRWEDGDWFCINKSGSIVKCPSSSNQESRS